MTAPMTSLVWKTHIYHPLGDIIDVSFSSSSSSSSSNFLLLFLCSSSSHAVQLSLTVLCVNEFESNKFVSCSNGILPREYLSSIEGGNKTNWKGCNYFSMCGEKACHDFKLFKCFFFLIIAKPILVFLITSITWET